ncbi:MAG: hypothetical protein QXG02_04345 [Candidatus Anstonellales archaeon]
MRMASLTGIYVEKDYYKHYEITGKHIDALRALGIQLSILKNGDVRIISDTSTQAHDFCDVSAEECVLRRRIDI